MKKIIWLIIILAVIAGGGYGLYLFVKPRAPIHPASANEPVTDASAARPSVSVQLTMAKGQAYLTDSNGMTLYYFAKDVPNASNCPPGPCLDLWPLFLGETISVESPLLAADFSVIARPDGGKQTAYKGWPLYYFANDKKPGDTQGQGSMGVWFTVPLPFYTILVVNSSAADGSYLADAAGRTLYFFKNDTIGTPTTPAVSNCLDTCLTAWPAFYTDKIVLPSAISPTDITVIARLDGSKQAAYKGRPLYYYSGDPGPGDLKGQGVDGAWSVAVP
jgi:predicted lipoprotein with Yx(FWY)xxD motif